MKKIIIIAVSLLTSFSVLAQDTTSTQAGKKMSKREQKIELAKINAETKKNEYLYLTEKAKADAAATAETAKATAAVNATTTQGGTAMLPQNGNANTRITTEMTPEAVKHEEAMAKEDRKKAARVARAERYNDYQSGGGFYTLRSGRPW